MRYLPGLLTPRRAEKPVKKITTYSKYSHQSTILDDDCSNSPFVSSKRAWLGSEPPSGGRELSRTHALVSVDNNNALGTKNSSLTRRFVEDDKENASSKRQKGIYDERHHEADKPDHPEINRKSSAAVDETLELEHDSVYGEEAEETGDDSEEVVAKEHQLATRISTDPHAATTDTYANYAKEMEDTYDASTGAFQGTEYYRVRRIAGLKRVKGGVRYLVEWEGKDPVTGQAWLPTWEPKSYMPADVLADFNNGSTRKRKRQA